MKSNGGSKEPSSPRRSRPIPRGQWIALAVAVLLLLWAAAHFLVLAPLQDAGQVGQSKQASVERIIEDIGYFTGPRAIPNLDQDVSNLGLADVKKLREVARSAGQMVETMRSGDFDKMRSAKSEYEKLAGQYPLNCPNIFAAFNAVAAKLGEITGFETELSSAKVSAGDFEGFEKLQAKGASIGSALGDAVPAETKAKLERVVHTKLAQGLLALLKNPTAPARDYGWFESTWGQLKLKPGGPESKAALDEVQRVAVDWQMVESLQPDKPVANLKARLKEDTSNRVWPAWLRAQAEDKIAVAQASDMGADEAGPRAIPAEPPRSRVVGGAPSTAPLPWMFFLADDNRFPVELPDRGENVNFFLRAQANADEELKPTGGVLARGLGPNGESFKSYNGRLITGKAAPPTPYILVGKRADGAEAFQIYVGLGRLDKAIFGAMDGGLKLEGDKIVVDVSKLPGGVLQPLWLRLPSAFGVKGSTIKFIGVRAQRANIAPVVKEMKTQIQKQSEAASPAAPAPATGAAVPPGSSSEPSTDGLKATATPMSKPAGQITATPKPATPAPVDPKPLAAHPLLAGKLPPGTYTLLVGDGDHKVPLVDFQDTVAFGRVQPAV